MQADTITLEFSQTLPFEAIRYEWENHEHNEAVYAVSQETKIGRTRIMVLSAVER